MDSYKQAQRAVIQFLSTEGVSETDLHILHSTVNVGSTNTFCRQKLDYCALSLFVGIHGTIVNCYLASVSGVYQISPDIHCHLSEKSQSSTAGNYGAPTSVPLSLGHALYLYSFCVTFVFCSSFISGTCAIKPALQ
jgi:hypothetical protein